MNSTIKTINATCVMPLNDANRALLKMMQCNMPEPEGATHIAFLEDGDACFLDSVDLSSPNGFSFPRIKVITYYENVEIQFTD